jgi:hypothetical protein
MEFHFDHFFNSVNLFVQNRKKERKCKIGKKKGSAESKDEKRENEMPYKVWKYVSLNVVTELIENGGRTP